MRHLGARGGDGAWFRARVRARARGGKGKKEVWEKERYQTVMM